MRHRTSRAGPRPIVVTAAAATLCLALATAGGGAAWAADDDAHAFLQAINASRSSLAGTAPLRASDELARVAADHAAAMAAKGSIFHNPSLGQQVTSWEVVGENVGVGPDVTTLHQAFLDSPSHRANLLDGRYRELGIGIARTNGQLWVVEVFRKPVTAAPAAAAAPAPAPEPVAASVAPAPARAPAPTAGAASAPVAAPGPRTTAAPAPAPAPVAVTDPMLELDVSEPMVDELAEQSALRWGTLVTPAPPALGADAPPAPTSDAGSPVHDVAALAALALWLAAAGPAAVRVRRTGLGGLRPARAALRPA